MEDEIYKRWEAKLQASVICDNWSSAKEILHHAIAETRASERQLHSASSTRIWRIEKQDMDGKNVEVLQERDWKELALKIGLIYEKEYPKHCIRVRGYQIFEDLPPSEFTPPSELEGISSPDTKSRCLATLPSPKQPSREAQGEVASTR